jgi:hypothetical protein
VSAGVEFVVLGLVRVLELKYGVLFEEGNALFLDVQGRRGRLDFRVLLEVIVEACDGSGF